MKNWSINHKILYLLIFFSGIAALIYELIWIRVLNLTFGVSGFAIATVIAVFLLGLGLGSIYYGRVAEKTKNLLKTYAFIEFGIGIISLIVFILLTKTSIIDSVLAYGYNNFNLYIHSILRLLVSFVILLPPTFFIGGTVPIIVKYLIKNNNKIGSQFSIIYYINTLGAVIGVFATGLYLVKFFGMTNTFCIAVIINILISFSVIIFKKKINFSTTQPELDSPSPKLTTKPVKEMLLILFFTGFVTFGFEVLLIRILNNFGLATTFSSTLIIGGFLIGITLGSFYISKVVDKIKNLIKHFILYSTLVAVVSAGSIIILSKLNNFYPTLSGNYSHQLTEAWTGFGLALILSIILGTLFPLGVRIFLGNKEVIGEKIGKVYLVNSIGSLFGSILMGFLFIPFLGIKISLILIVGLIFFIPIYLHFRNYKNPKKINIIISSSIIISIIFIIISNNTFFRILPEDTVIFYEEGISATVTVIKNSEKLGGYKSLNIDSQNVAGNIPSLVADAKILAHIPLMLVNEPTNALTVGYGTGGTSYSMLLHNIEVYALEIEQEVINASTKFVAMNHGVEKNPNLNIIIDDARNFLNKTDMKFDAIVTDVTNVKYKSNPYLYTTDYFQIIKNRLTEKGIGAAWVPLGGLSFNDLNVLTASFQKIFPHTTIWHYSADIGGFLLFIGTPNKLVIDLDYLSNLNSKIMQDLKEIFINDKYELAAMLLLGEKDVKNLVQNTIFHTDDKPILEFSDMNFYIQYNPLDNIASLFSYQIEILKPYFKFSTEEEYTLLEALANNRIKIRHYIEEHN